MQDALCTISVFFILHFTYFFGGGSASAPDAPRCLRTCSLCAIDWWRGRLGVLSYRRRLLPGGGGGGRSRDLVSGTGESISR